MVGFPAKQAKPVEEEEEVELPIDQNSKVKDALDFPCIDSYLDFDSCNWLGNNPNIDEFGVKDTDFDFFEDEMEAIGQGGEEVQNTVLSEAEPKLCDDVAAEQAVEELGSAVSDNSKPMEDVSASVDCPNMKLDEPELKKTDVCLALGLEKVSLTTGDDEKGKSISIIAESESEEASSSSSSSSSSGSSSSEDEEEEEESDEEDSEEEEDEMVIVKEDGVAGELEEGEIESADEVEEDEDEDSDDDDDDDEVNEMIAWSNDEDDDLGLQTKDPIRSKNELKVPNTSPLHIHNRSQLLVVDLFLYYNKKSKVPFTILYTTACLTLSLLCV